MLHQFNILVLSKKAVPAIEDPALGWLFANDFSEVAEALDAEWTVIAKPEVQITREFLNAVADFCQEFPFADAFSPRIFQKSTGKVFSSGLLMDFRRGLDAEFRTNEKVEIRPVAAASPECGIYSTRLLRALRGFDPELLTDARFLDLGLRALHLGANLFAAPHISVRSEVPPKPSEGNFLAELGRVYYKDLDILKFFRFAIHHPTALGALFKNRKELDKKSLEVTELSRFTDEMFQKVSRR